MRASARRGWNWSALSLNKRRPSYKRRSAILQYCDDSHRASDFLFQYVAQLLVGEYDVRLLLQGGLILLLEFLAQFRGPEQFARLRDKFARVLIGDRLISVE